MIGLTVCSIGTLPIRQAPYRPRPSGGANRPSPIEITSTTPKCKGSMPSLTATGSNNGPKMMSAAAPSSTEPITISTAIDSSMNSQVPCAADSDNIISPTVCGTCCKVRMKASDCAAATMNSTNPERVAACTKLCAAVLKPSSPNTSRPTTIAYIAANAEISVAVANPLLKPAKIMKISPNDAMAPLQRPDMAICGSIASVVAGRFPNTIDTTMSANAINPAGSSPATNRPPIDRLATKPRMIRLMQGGMVSAITADAASRATALPGLCLVRRAAGISTDPTAATSAILEPEIPENSTIDITMTTLRPPRMRPTARCSNSMRRTDIPLASMR